MGFLHAVHQIYMHRAGQPPQVPGYFGTFPHLERPLFPSPGRSIDQHGDYMAVIWRNEQPLSKQLWQLSRGILFLFGGERGVLRVWNLCQSHHDDQLLPPRTLLSRGLWLGLFLARLPSKSNDNQWEFKLRCSVLLSSIHPSCTELSQSGTIPSTLASFYTLCCFF